ncbi:hypothetical protein BUALT_Bualt02G0002100 [Buddleja alternifolia]|uniref:peptidylprolyl isomerase n=1 Tax=Buddleja alternifolia TaxID=168488 RepID=A0AAV6Y2P6_9LAMI|nr:hypothetical protein BUALT_Bualt02G0002100 [Buddleja alternifolia]
MRSRFVFNVASIILLLAFIAFGSAKKSADVTELQIGVKYKPKACEVKAHKGDSIKVHYRIRISMLNPLASVSWEEKKLTDCNANPLGNSFSNCITVPLGKLTDGTVFDSSFERGDPIEFELGSGQVIKGWDQGILGMCLGEKRKLKIPSKLGYGDQGSPPTIPGGATLVFDTELVGVNGKTLDDGKSNESEL